MVNSIAARSLGKTSPNWSKSVTICEDSSRMYRFSALRFRSDFLRKV